VLGDLSSLKLLASYADEARLTRLEFDTLSGHYRKTPLGVEVTKLEGEVIGLFRVRGNFAISAEGRMSGELEVGLPEALLNRRTEGKPDFFGLAEDGFCWVTTTIEGRNNEPVDDLNPRFEKEAAAMKMRSGNLRLNPDDPAPPVPNPTAPAPEAVRPLMPGDPSVSTDREKALEDTFDSLLGE